MIEAIRFVEKALGKVTYQFDEQTRKSSWGRRSLYISSNIKKGEAITSQNIKCVRPSLGLHPKYWEYVLGKKSRKDLECGDRLRLEDLE